MEGFTNDVWKFYCKVSLASIDECDLILVNGIKHVLAKEYEMAILYRASKPALPLKAYEDQSAFNLFL